MILGGTAVLRREVAPCRLRNQHPTDSPARDIDEQVHRAPKQVPLPEENASIRPAALKWAKASLHVRCRNDVVLCPSVLEHLDVEFLAKLCLA